MARRKNVLLFMVDGHRTDQLGCYGGTLADTPRIDAFAEDAVRCTQAYCAHSVCMPTRATIYTGRYPHVHGVWANGVPLPQCELTMAEVLRRHGYATGACGKIHFEPQQAYLQTRRELSDGARALIPAITPDKTPYYGFNDVHISENLLGTEYVDFVRETAPSQLQRVMGRRDVPESVHELTWITDQAASFMQRQVEADTPFFCHCSFHELSPPCTPPAEYGGYTDPGDVRIPALREDDLAAKPPWYRHCHEGYSRKGIQPDEQALRHAIASCHDQMRFIDRQFGRLLDLLSELGILDDTIVLYTADHGLSLNDHWQWRHGPFLFDEVVHIPMIWRGPGARGVCDGMIEQVDIMPTILDLCGIERVDGLQGESLCRMFAMPETFSGKEAVLLQERQAPDLKVREINPSTITQVGLRTPHWKIVRYAGESFGELYNLDDDPGEYHNMWNSPGTEAVRRRLSAQLLDRLYASSPFPRCPYDW